jgi:Fe-S-cluster containining protein
MTYDEIKAAWDEEFARNRDIHGARIRCRAGCSDCCHQLFQITEVEAAEIHRAVLALPDRQRADLRRRSLHYLARRKGIVAHESWGGLPPPGSRLACPALDNGACSIYNHRPLICRRFGIPLYNPDRPDRVGACELNFRPGEEIDDGELVRIHTDLHQAWKAVQAAYNAAGGHRDPEPYTVARAIVEPVPD